MSGCGVKTRSILGPDLLLLRENGEISSENQKNIFPKNHRWCKAFMAMTMPDWVLISVQAWSNGFSHRRLSGLQPPHPETCSTLLRLSPSYNGLKRLISHRGVCLHWRKKCWLTFSTAAVNSRFHEKAQSGLNCPMNLFVCILPLSLLPALLSTQTNLRGWIYFLLFGNRKIQGGFFNCQVQKS